MIERPTRRQFSELIQALTDDGLCASEIGERLGMSRQRVMRIAAQFGVRLQPRGGSRRVGAQFSGRRYQVLDALAQQAGVSTGTMLTRIVGLVVDEGHAQAARRLGREAIPKRPYRRRQPA